MQFMKFVVTTKNKSSDEYGLFERIDKPHLAEYLLGYTDHREGRKYIVYIPEKISYTVEQVWPLTFLRKYLGIGYLPKPYLIKRAEFIDKLYRSPKLHEFLREFETFIIENPDFMENKRKYYKKPFPSEKSKKKFVNGNWVKQYRMITEPKPELKRLQSMAYNVIVNVFGYKPNDNTHSYTPNRSNITNAEPHKHSNHVVKLDIKKFFPSINETFLRTRLHSLKEFAILQIDDIKLYRTEQQEKFNLFFNLTRQFVDAVVALGILQNELPQGSPLSPVLSNIVMAEYDNLIEDYCKSKTASKSKIMYTRYADDLTLSSFRPIKLKKLINEIQKILKDTPLKLHPDKVAYKKVTQRLFITGVKLNKDHNLTYGHEKKEELKRDIFQALMMIKNGQKDIQENQELIGRINYAMQIEPEHIQQIVTKYARKFRIAPDKFYKHLVVS